MADAKVVLKDGEKVNAAGFVVNDKDQLVLDEANKPKVAASKGLEVDKACVGSFAKLFRAVAVRGNGKGGHRAELEFNAAHYAGEGDSAMDAIADMFENADKGAVASFPAVTVGKEVVKVSNPLPSESRPFPDGPRVTTVPTVSVSTAKPYDSRSDAQKAIDEKNGFDSRSAAQKEADSKK